MTDDDHIMIRIQEGDPHAINDLIARHQGPLIGFFLRNTRDRHFAEDMTQETLLRVYNQAWDYLPMGRFKGWMYRIARNLLIDNIRKQSRDALVHASKGHVEGTEDAMQRISDEILSPEERAATGEIAKIVDELLLKVPELQRQTFTLHHYAGLKLSEVARIMESTVSTTKSRLRLAREKLQYLLTLRGIGEA